jgi:hypothetical protein
MKRVQTKEVDGRKVKLLVTKGTLVELENTCSGERKGEFGLNKPSR